MGYTARELVVDLVLTFAFTHLATLPDVFGEIGRGVLVRQEGDARLRPMRATVAED